MKDPVRGDFRIILFLVAQLASRGDEVVSRVRAKRKIIARNFDAKEIVVTPAIVTGAIEREVSSVGAPSDGKGSFDVVLEIVLDHRPSESFVRKNLAVLATSIGDIVSPDASVAYVGRDVIFDEERSTLKYFSLLKAHENVGHDEALQGWETQAGPNLATHPTRVGYIEQQGDLLLTRAAIEGTRYNGGEYTGVAVEWFPSAESTLEAYAWGTSAKSAELAEDPPAEGGIIALLCRYFDMTGTGKIHFGHETEPTRV